MFCTFFAFELYHRSAPDIRNIVKRSWALQRLEGQRKRSGSLVIELRLFCFQGQLSLFI